MIKKITILSVFSLLLSFKCKEVNQKITIHPLNPYSESPAYYNLHEDKSRSYILKYFFIDGADNVNNAVTEQVDNFVRDYIVHDTDFNFYGNYQLFFYRKTDILNENYRQNINSSVAETSLDDFDNDLLYKYLWRSKNFLNRDSYDNGKVINSKKGKTLKNQDSSSLKLKNQVKYKDLGY